MENATKALLMAAGVLIGVLVLSLGVGYTIIFMKFYMEVKNGEYENKAEQEQCQSAEDKSEE